jgi:Outer membrane protein beta-barrel domain
MRTKIAIGLVFLALSAGGTAFAQDKGAVNADAGSLYAGGLLGLTFPSGGSDMLFGATLGYKTTPNWGLGLYATYTGSSTEIPGLASQDTSNVIAALEGSYYFQDNMPGLRLGGKAGMLFFSATQTGAADVSDSNFVLGPHVGYDYGLGGGLSVGAEFNILFSTKKGSDAIPNILGAIKYWF